MPWTVIAHSFNLHTLFQPLNKAMTMNRQKIFDNWQTQKKRESRAHFESIVKFVFFVLNQTIEVLTLCDGILICVERRTNRHEKKAAHRPSTKKRE